MNQQQGLFIVIEGTDGSGKGTQFQKLAERLSASGHEVATFDFPQYDSPSSFFVKEYLNGKYGSAEAVGPYTGSLFYALDRYQAAPQIREALGKGKIVLANRFVGSNMAHQGTKFRHAEERRGYFIWLDNLEFEMLGTPRPTLSFVLRVPAEIAQQLVSQKAARNYTDKKHDLHEADLAHMEKAVEVYDDLCQLFPKDFMRVDCVRDSKLLDIESVHELLWQHIQPMLPAPKPKAPPATVPVTPDASIRQGAPENEHTEATPATGDSAIIELTAENASSWLALQLSSQAQVSCKEPAPLSIAYDQKDANGQYRYFTPSYLPAETSAHYRDHMNAIFELYAAMTTRLTDYLMAMSPVPFAQRDQVFEDAIQAQVRETLQPVLPVAITIDVDVAASALSLADLATNLLSSSMPEARAAGEGIVRQARAILPTFLEHLRQADISHLSGSRLAIAEVAETRLPAVHTAAVEPLQLVDVWPRNELDIVPDMLYPHSNLPVKELRIAVDTWAYTQKMDVLETYLGQYPGPALEKILYSWDVFGDYASLRGIQRGQLTSHAAWQALTPRYGYEVSKLVEDAGLADQFEACFDISLKLYSILQQAGYQQEAQYATLFGHRVRWNITFNAREAFNLLGQSADHQKTFGSDKLRQAMHEKIGEVHPTLAEALRPTA